MKRNKKALKKKTHKPVCSNCRAGIELGDSCFTVSFKVKLHNHCFPEFMHDMGALLNRK